MNDKKESVLRSIRVPPDLNDCITDVARGLGTKWSSAVIMALTQYFEAQLSAKGARINTKLIRHDWSKSDDADTQEGG